MQINISVKEVTPIAESFKSLSLTSYKIWNVYVLDICSSIFTILYAMQANNRTHIQRGMVLY